MSQENVESVREAHAAFTRGDLEAFLKYWHPQAEYRAAITQMIEGEAGDFRGHDGLRLWWRDLHALYDGLLTNLLEVRDLGEQVLVVFEIHGRGKASGLILTETLAQVVAFADGQIRQVHDFLSRADALEAVRLSERQHSD